MAEFDPLGLVKAMGPQRDPYSWAELYAQDASKQQMSRDELKNRMLIQEMTARERAKEGQLDRENRLQSVREQIAGAGARLKERLATPGRTGAGPKHAQLPPNSIPAEEFPQYARRNKIDRSKWGLQMVHGKWVYSPIGSPAPSATGGDKPAPKSRAGDDYDEDEEE